MLIKSAIMQMFCGERGGCDYIPSSNESLRLLDLFEEKEKEFVSKLAEYSNLLDFYRELRELNEQLIAADCDDFYHEGFRFGALMGLDIAYYKPKHGKDE